MTGMIRKFIKVIIKDPLKDIFWKASQIICIPFLVALGAFITNCECRDVPRSSHQPAQLKPTDSSGIQQFGLSLQKGSVLSLSAGQFKHNFC